MKSPFSKNEKLPRRVKKLFTPGRDFTQKAKVRFLATFDAAQAGADARAGAHAHAGLATVRGSRFALAMKILATGAAAFAIFIASASVYADTTNVSIESPLYPLKRLAENVQLAVTPAAAKPQLEATFATRRASEINDLETTHPTSTLLPTLAADLNADVTASINGAKQQEGAGGGTSVQATSTATSSVRTGYGSSGNNGNKKSALASVCDTLRPLLGASPVFASSSAFSGSSSSRGGVLGHLQVTARIDVYTQCGGALPGNSVTPDASSTAPASTNATSTPRGNFPGRRRIFPGSSAPRGTFSTSTASSTASSASSSTRIFPPFRTFASSSIPTSTRILHRGNPAPSASAAVSTTLEGTFGL